MKDANLVSITKRNRGVALFDLGLVDELVRRAFGILPTRKKPRILIGAFLFPNAVIPQERDVLYSVRVFQWMALVEDEKE